MKRIVVGLFILSNLFMITSCGHEHDFGEIKIIKVATCSETGLKESKCKICGEIKTEELNKLEHVYESDKETSTEIGLDAQVCVLCGEKRQVKLTSCFCLLIFTKIRILFLWDLPIANL